MKIKSLVMLLGLVSFSCLGRADFYTVSDIAVQASGETPKEAKNIAIEEAERQAFSRLMRRLIGQENSFVDNLPEMSEIVSLVQDFSLKNEKNNTTEYWAKVDVRFNPVASQNFLTSKRVDYLQKEPAKLLVIPVVKNGLYWLGLEDSNVFYQLLRSRNALSDFYEMVLPVGDLDEIVAVNKMLKENNVFGLSAMLNRYDAQEILLLKAEEVGLDNWRVRGEIYREGTLVQEQTAFDWYRGYTMEEGFQKVLTQLEEQWREEQKSLPKQNMSYYARIQAPNLTQWNRDKKKIEALKFIENVVVQGVYKDQVLISFTFNLRLMTIMLRNDLDEFRYR